MTTSISSTGTLSSAGVGSGLDVASIISQLMAVESQPVTLLQNQESTINTQISALGKVTSLLSTLQTSVESFSTATNMLALTGTVANSSVASATVGNTAVAGTYSLAVSQLASQNKLVSSTFASSSTSLGSGSGSLTIDFGSVDSSGNFTTNSNRSSATIDLSSSQMTLSGVRDAINSANAGVTASLVTDSAGTRLMIVNNTTGANQSMRISVSDPDGDNTDSSGLSALAYDPSASSGSGKNMTQTSAASDAAFSIDGISLTSSTNTISNVMDGVSLTLTGTTSSNSPTTLTIAQDDTTIKSTVNSFITAYNNLASQLKTLTSYNSSTQTAGTLQGDSTTLSIEQQLRTAITTAFGSGSISRLADIGITFQSDGTLSLDETKFDNQFSSNRDAVVDLFTQDSSGTSGKGLGGTLDNLITNFIGGTGSLTTYTNSLNTRIQDINKEISDQQSQLSVIQARYQAQFSALDTIVSQNESLASYLTQQFSSSSSSS